MPTGACAANQRRSTSEAIGLARLSCRAANGAPRLRSARRPGSAATPFRTIGITVDLEAGGTLENA